MYNKLDDIDLQVEDIERQIKKYNLTFPSLKRNDIENKMRFPYFVNEFYNFIDEHKKIPMQCELYSFYKNKHRDIIDKLKDGQLPGLKARIYRAYPSYIRDLHFAKLLRKKTCFEKVIYNLELDVKDGIDILIKHNNKKYAINLYVKTDRSKYYRKKKNNRHKEHNFINIDLPIGFEDSYKLGEFYLYSYRDIVRLFNFILKVA
ncbi:MAG: hypothetical protein ACOCP8_07590 [archaeon]